MKCCDDMFMLEDVGSEVSEVNMRDDAGFIGSELKDSEPRFSSKVLPS